MKLAVVLVSLLGLLRSVYTCPTCFLEPPCDVFNGPCPKPQNPVVFINVPDVRPINQLKQKFLTPILRLIYPQPPEVKPDFQPVIIPIVRPVITPLAPVVRPIYRPELFPLAPIVRPIYRPEENPLAPIVRPISQPEANPFAPIVHPVYRPIGPFIRPIY